MKRLVMTLFPCIFVLMLVAGQPRGLPLHFTTFPRRENVGVGLASTRVSASIAKTKCSGWNVVFSPSPGAENALNGVAAASSTDAFAVGYFQKSAAKKTLTEHWDGKAWSVVASPNLAGDNILHAVAAVPGTDTFWAVGENVTAGQGLILYWNGTAWSMAFSPKNGKGYTLQGVAAASANDVWAVGRGSRLSTLVEHWNGAQWSIVASPASGDLLSVSAIASNEAWAVGENTKAQTLTERWDGTTWREVASPNPDKQWPHQLAGVTQIAGTNEVWAVGSRPNIMTPFLSEHWNGKQWSIVHVPVAFSGWNVFNGVASAGGPNSVVAVGWGSPDDGGAFPYPIIEQWGGLRWNPVYRSGNRAYLNAVTAIPGSRNFWAVGDTDINGHLIPHKTYILYRC